MSRSSHRGRIRRVIAACLFLSCTVVALPAAVPGAGQSGGGALVARLGEFASPVALSSSPTDDELTAFLSAVHADLAAFWTRVLTARALAAPTTRLTLFRASEMPVLSTACGAVGADVGPFFCGGDGTIYLSLEFARVVWTQVGDMALVAVVAHEFGHGIQQELGIRAVAGSPVSELQADCLSGAYGQDAAARALLQPGDVEEARRLSRLVGDSAPNADPHGSADQREQAWVGGYSGGVAACISL